MGCAPERRKALQAILDRFDSDVVHQEQGGAAQGAKLF